MTDTIATVEVTFEALIKTISALSLKDKNRLYDLLYEQVEQEEEDLLQQDPEVRAEIEQALKDYESSDYVTIQEYIAQQSIRED